MRERKKECEEFVARLPPLVIANAPAAQAKLRRREPKSSRFRGAIHKANGRNARPNQARHIIRIDHLRNRDFARPRQNVLFQASEQCKHLAACYLERSSLVIHPCLPDPKSITAAGNSHVAGNLPAKIHFKVASYFA